MLRRTPLRRKTSLRARGRTKHSRRQRDWIYMAFVRSRPCAARVLVVGGNDCAGRIEANHVGGRYGANADRRCVPMCSKHHEDWTGRVGGGGVFSGWPVWRRREWGRAAIAETLAAYEGRA